MFHTLDTFLERTQHESMLGQATLKKFASQPSNIRHFLSALHADLEKNSLRQYVQNSANVLLVNQYNSMIDAYLGEHGLMNIHAMKAYGFMKINFRNGRLEQMAAIGECYCAKRTAKKNLRQF